MYYDVYRVLKLFCIEISFYNIWAIFLSKVLIGRIYLGILFCISSKLRIAWEIHVCVVSISKNPKKTNFFGDFSRRHFSFPRIHILIMASDPSRRGSNFCRFFGLARRKNNDILGIYFVRNNCVFSDAPEPVQNKIQKKVTFLGNFPGCIFHHVSFSWLCFYTVLSGWSTTSGWASEKTPFFRREKMSFFRTEKMTFFRVRQYGAFWLQHSHCGNGYHISVPTGLNLESAEISTSKLADSKQQMSQSILQFLKGVHLSHFLWSGGNGQELWAHFGGVETLE